jgi:hypothetical protein
VVDGISLQNLLKTISVKLTLQMKNEILESGVSLSVHLSNMMDLEVSLDEELYETAI